MRITLVSSENSFYDFDITDAGCIKRATVSKSISRGDTFNIYCADSRKTSGVWLAHGIDDKTALEATQAAVMASDEYTDPSSKQKLLVACKNSNGDADIFVCEFWASVNEVMLGSHHDKAEALAAEQGYTGPFICFDHHEQQNIARQVVEIDCPIPFQLEEKSDPAKGFTSGTVQFGCDGVSLSVDGYSDYHSDDTNGSISLLERYEDTIFMRVYGDIQTDEPTHQIDLSSARVSNRCE